MSGAGGHGGGATLCWSRGLRRTRASGPVRAARADWGRACSWRGTRLRAGRGKGRSRRLSGAGGHGGAATSCWTRGMRRTWASRPVRAVRMDRRRAYNWRHSRLRAGRDKGRSRRLAQARGHGGGATSCWGRGLRRIRASGAARAARIGRRRACSWRDTWLNAFRHGRRSSKRLAGAGGDGGGATPGWGRGLRRTRASRLVWAARAGWGRACDWRDTWLNAGRGKGGSSKRLSGAGGHGGGATRCWGRGLRRVRALRGRDSSGSRRCKRTARRSRCTRAKGVGRRSPFTSR